MVALFGIFGNAIDVRFTPDSNRMADIAERQRCAMCGWLRVGRENRYPEHVIRAQPLDRELARVLGKVELHSGTLAGRK
jgi:hypothetical protein